MPRREIKERHIIAILSLIFSYVAFFSWSNPFLGIFLAILGIVLGWIGRHAEFPYYMFVGGRMGKVGIWLGVWAMGLMIFFHYLSSSY